MRISRLIPVLLLCLPVTAWSVGGHYPVDDADLPDPREFGAELWHTVLDSDNSESAFSAFWRPGSLPVELIAEFQHLDEDGVSSNRFEPQIKYQLEPLASGQMGAAIMVHAGYEGGEVADWLVNVPFSYVLSDTPITLHGNLGWIHERGETSRDRGYLGGAVEWDAFERLTVIGQVYREGADAETEAQLGLRTPLGGPVEHLDIAVGQELTGDDNDWFVTVGLAFAF
ncbi:hypothetical protein IC757_07035 [Wenzhouxiangella sp. AB-CW3]|uniref:hypothetical protein n=1 Tax=Wenzhouxiangella sp. AB-CW3 TaxID=2771012 RepID=UPI00168B3155|nr:hypothetical protein [Wenzhouxiangella sp. AB-CW3]QOC23866.1 hypothetical protein IC757_07035 [Wenzhouxiangella sp. AB-CW3]